jgi:hypothetical protein
LVQLPAPSGPLTGIVRRGDDVVDFQTGRNILGPCGDGHSLRDADCRGDGALHESPPVDHVHVPT